MSASDQQRRRRIRLYFWPWPHPALWGVPLLLLGLAALLGARPGEVGVFCLLAAACCYAARAVVRALRRKLSVHIPIYISSLWGHGFLFLAVSTFVTFVLPDTTWLLSGLALLTASFLLLWVVHSRLCPSDKEIDTWLQDDLSRLSAKAFQMLRLERGDLVNDELWISGPNLAPNDPRVRVRLGRDKVLRFASHNVLFMLLTKRYMGIFQCKFDFRQNEPYMLSASELGYRHITSTELFEPNEVHDGEKMFEYRRKGTGTKIFPAQVFRIKSTDGRSVEIPTRVKDEAKKSSRLEPMGTPLEKTAHIVSSFIRTLNP